MVSDINQILSLEKSREERNEYQLSIEAILHDIYMIVSLLLGLFLLFVLKRTKIMFRGDPDESNRKLVTQLLSK